MVLSKFKKVSTSLALLCAVLYSLYIFAGLGTYVNFLIQQEYIANVLCINKDVPEMNCHGKCYFTKEFSKITENDDSTLLPDLKIPSYFENYIDTGFQNPILTVSETPVLHTYLLLDSQVSMEPSVPPPRQLA